MLFLDRSIQIYSIQTTKKIFRIHKINAFFFANNSDIVNSVDFFFSGKLFLHQHSKRSINIKVKERKNVVFIHKQADAMEQLAKQEYFTLCLNLLMKKGKSVFPDGNKTS